MPSVFPLAEALEWEEGDIVVRAGKCRAFEIERDDTRHKALETIRSFKLKLPKDWKFDREDANER